MTLADRTPAPAEPVPTYRDAARSIDERADDLLERMTLDEKIDCLANRAAVPRLGVKGSPHIEGYHGVAQGGPSNWGRRNPAATTQFPQAYGLGSTGGTLAYSRFHESEADFIGLRYSAYAGYDPRAAITFWKKMSAGKTGGWLMTLLSTHPADAQRIAAMEKELPSVLPIYEANRRKE